jgi:hypothetical protein
MNARSILTTSALLVAALPGGVYAQASITAEQASCFRAADNQVVHVSAANEPAGDSARLYFRWEDHGPFYWVDLEHDGPGRYWAVPPKPDKPNLQVEYYATLLDAQGREAARSVSRKVRVTADCKVELTPKQFGVAQNLTIGETDDKQARKRVMGFLCDGIVTRVSYQNIRRADETCRTCAVAWWQQKAVLGPLLAGSLVGITTIVVDHPEPSPSRP